MDDLAELRGEILALETALAAAFGKVAALWMAVIGCEAKTAGQAGAAAGLEYRMERIAHALRNAIGFQDR